MGNTSKIWYRSFYNILVTLIVVAVFSWFWYKELNVLLEKEFLMKGNYLTIMVYWVVVMFFVGIFGGYKIGVSKKSHIILSQAIGLLFADGIQVIITVLMVGYRHLIMSIIITMGKVFVIQFSFVFVLAIIFISLYFKIFPPYKMLHIRGNHDNSLVAKFNTRNDKYVITGEMDYDDDIEKISAAVDGYDAVIINDAPTETRNRILKICFAKGKKVYLTPKISDIIVRGAEKLDVFDTPLLFSRNTTFTLSQRMIKRCSDIFFSLLGLIILSPLMILVSLAIFLYDRGPVFYRQTRYTKDGKTFKILKFRSMIPNAEKDGVARLAADNDSRITPVGRFIRACRLDELPQFFNILAGDMSFVGPRPERPEIADEYTKEVPEFAFRLKVKAGLTGYAQIYGKYNTTSYDKLKLDMIYVENCSLLMDLKLLLLTLKVIFMKESTEGLEEGQITASNKR